MTRNFFAPNDTRAPSGRRTEGRLGLHTDHQPATPPSAERSLLLELRRAEHLLEQHVTRGTAAVTTALDLTPERRRVMAALAAEPGQSMTALSQASVLPPASLTRHVDRLVAQGLVARTHHSDDRRRVVADLTESGMQAWTQVQAGEARVADALREVVGPERFDTLLAEFRAASEALAEL